MAETRKRISSRLEYLTQEIDVLHAIIKKQSQRIEDLELFVASLASDQGASDGEYGMDYV